MQQINTSTFGYVIAYIIPGALIWMTLPKNLQNTLTDNFGSGTIGGLVSTTIVVLFLGLVVSAVRWLVIDRIHHWTGVRPSTWDFLKLRENLAAFESVGSFQYQYYQFYANSLVALAIATISLKFRSGEIVSWIDIPLIALMAIFWLASRDTLTKYYARIDQILS